jgi:hypothetical protein
MRCPGPASEVAGVAGTSGSRPSALRHAPCLNSLSMLTQCILPLLLSASHLLTIQASTLTVTWNSAADVRVNAATYAATGNDIAFTLNCVPTASELTVLIKGRRNNYDCY